MLAVFRGSLTAKCPQNGHPPAPGLVLAHPGPPQPPGFLLREQGPAQDGAALSWPVCGSRAAQSSQMLCRAGAGGNGGTQGGWEKPGSLWDRQGGDRAPGKIKQASKSWEQRRIECTEGHLPAYVLGILAITNSSAQVRGRKERAGTPLSPMTFIQNSSLGVEAFLLLGSISYLRWITGTRAIKIVICKMKSMKDISCKNTARCYINRLSIQTTIINNSTGDTAV